jgi:type IV fimbrial biogenesis protein FimT
MKTDCQGFTLVELMVTIAIIAIICMLAAPFLLQIQKKNEAEWFHTNFSNAFSNARSWAVIHHQPIVICGSSSISNLCDHRWDSGIAVFIDKNNNSQYDNEEKLLKYEQSVIRYAEIKLKISLGKRVIKVTSDRALFSGYFGKFLYCSSDAKLTRAVIWGVMGNKRISKDTDGDGLHDDNGVILNCS